MANLVRFSKSKTSAQAKEVTDANVVHFTSDGQIIMGQKTYGNSVTSVAGKTGAVTVTKSDVGLGNVTNGGSGDRYMICLDYCHGESGACPLIRSQKKEISFYTTFLSHYS